MLVRRWDTIENRWKSHCRAKNDCRVLRRAILKHGKLAFSLTLLCNVNTQQELDIAEKYWISFFDCVAPSGYNLKSGGSQGKHCLETKTKMSISQKKRQLENPHSEQTKRAISMSLMGRKVGERKLPPPFSEETRQKMSEAKKYKKMSPETREKMKLAWVIRRQNK